MVPQVIRPTGLLDPEVAIRPTQGQIEDLKQEILATIALGNRVLVTTLTKKMAEDLTTYLEDAHFKVQYLHSDIDTIERIEILRDLRLGVFDVLVGINLLREGLDLPEVGLVAILDADKEGFLRSRSALIQTMGRAARNARGHVILYADKVTDSMKAAIEVTQTRRAVQIAYNQKHGIDPVTVTKAVSDILGRLRGVTDAAAVSKRSKRSVIPMGPEEIAQSASDLETAMLEAANELRFEEAAALRDELHDLLLHSAEIATSS